MHIKPVSFLLTKNVLSVSVARLSIFSRPAASEVLTAYLTQCNEPPWTSYFVKRSSVRNDQFGMSNFNWRVGNSNYQILRTGCFPYIKYHCSKKEEEDLTVSDMFMRFIKVVNLGPPSLPIYGAFPIIRWYGRGRDLAKACTKLCQKYKTDILGLYLGAFPLVVINDPALIKEMLTKEEFDGRLDIFVARLRSYWKRLGIFFTDGYFWYIQRRASLRQLRDFGFGRRSQTLEMVTAREIQEMIDMRLEGPKTPAEKEIVKGDLVYPFFYFEVPFMNGMLHVLSGTTFPRSEYGTFWEMGRHSLLFARSTDDFGGAISLTPWLKYLAPGLSGYNGLRKGNQYLLEFFEKIVNDALETFDVSHDRHFLDVYIRKMKEEQKNNEKTTYSVDQLILTCVDYMLPTSTSGATMLSMLVERLLLQPEVQDKIHEEIDRVVGRDRRPTLDDRVNMPYIEGCIRETMRTDALVPMGVAHRTMKDTKLGPYDIPENVAVAANFVSLSMDTNIWGDPEKFRPERFIENGRLNIAKDKSLPFGAGRRLCAGETFSRQTMFLVFAGLMQTFRVTSADGKPYTKPATRVLGFITTMPEFWVRLTPRI